MKMHNVMTQTTSRSFRYFGGEMLYITSLTPPDSNVWNVDSIEPKPIIYQKLATVQRLNNFWNHFNSYQPADVLKT